MDTLDTVNTRMAAFSDWAPTVLRLGAGVVFLVYGAGKLFGVGPEAVGIEGFTGFLASLGVPAPGVFAWIVALIGIDMVFAIVLVHLPQGWDYQSGGFEYPLMLLFVMGTLVLAGPGRLSLDHSVFDTEARLSSAVSSSYDG